MANKKRFKSGTEVKRSGQYDLNGPRGGKYPTEYTLVKGEPFPPTPKKGMTFTLADPSKKKRS